MKDPICKFCNLGKQNIQRDEIEQQIEIASRTCICNGGKSMIKVYMGQKLSGKIVTAPFQGHIISTLQCILLVRWRLFPKVWFQLSMSGCLLAIRQCLTRIIWRKRLPKRLIYIASASSENGVQVQTVNQTSFLVGCRFWKAFVHNGFSYIKTIVLQHSLPPGVISKHRNFALRFSDCVH